MRRVSCVAGLLGAVLVVGCGSGDPFSRQAISGKVTVKGQPLKFGTITFEPQAGQQVSATASISDGRFKLAKDKGISPGKYKWHLNAPERESKAAEPGAADTGPPIKSLIAEKDNGKTFDVLADKDNVLDITIP